MELSVSVVTGFYITAHKPEVCNSMEHTSVQLESGLTLELTVTVHFDNIPSCMVVKATVTPDLMGVFLQDNIKLHFCQCDRFDIHP